MPRNFSFIIPGRLCAMECPGSYLPLEEDLGFLESQGVKAMISLTERRLPDEVLARFGFASVHLPIPDFTAPSVAAIDVFVRQVDAWVGEGLTVMVHCGAGYGRTGTMLGAYLVWQGLAAAEAIRRVREIRPLSIETKDQEMCIREFERHLSQWGR